jgi:hypothetical protein
LDEEPNIEPGHVNVAKVPIVLKNSLSEHFGCIMENTISQTS